MQNEIRFHLLSPTLVAIAAALVSLETFCFAMQRTNYSHIANTISELGETGAPHARFVAFGFFLPVGLLVWLALWLTHRVALGLDVSLILLAISCLGTGYVAAAFFPCDPGSPLFGSWRQQVHNIAGFIDYEGTGLGFLLTSRYFKKRNATVPAILFLLAGAFILFCLVLLSLEATFDIRGVIQRFAEIVQFSGVFFACYLLSKKTIFPSQLVAR